MKPQTATQQLITKNLAPNTWVSKLCLGCGTELIRQSNKGSPYCCKDCRLAYKKSYCREYVMRVDALKAQYRKEADEKALKQAKKEFCIK